MIVIVNSNIYVGGGETIMSRFARWLRDNGASVLGVCRKTSYLEDSFSLEGIRTLTLEEDCRNHRELPEIASLDVDRATFVVCQMQDFYSLVLTFPNVKLKLIYFCFHPEDYKYFSIYLPLRAKYQRRNLCNLRYVNGRRCFFVPSAGYADYLGLGEVHHPVAIPGFKLSAPSDATNECTEVLAISRFVGFKTGSLLTLLTLAKEDPSVRITIIGYGRLEFVLRFWIRVMSVQRIVRLVGSVPPEELDGYIRASHVCFAQGTSLLQCVAAGKPTLVHSYSKWYRCLFPSRRCAGIWGHHQEGLGEFYNLRMFDVVDSFNLIRSDYSEFSALTLQQALKWDPEVIFSYINREIKEKRIIDTSKIRVPSVPILRKIFLKLVSNG